MLPHPRGLFYCIVTILTPRIMKYSVIIPAHNEEKYINTCLDSIENATKPHGAHVEIIVVLNRCTDTTEQIARSRGAIVITENSKNLARIRNRGAAIASGDVIVTIDADSWMSKNMLCEIERMLRSRRYIGGGVRIRMERYSLGIRLSWMILHIIIFFTGLSGGLYWCYRKDFQAIGGFNENCALGEDLEFAGRLKEYGRTHGLKFTTLRTAHITTSCRKFDTFGDWVFLKLLFFRGKEISAAFYGTNHSLANKLIYDFKHSGNDRVEPPAQATLKKQ
jgi:glycosyltransferase involved in cell wall biosynthesis